MKLAEDFIDRPPEVGTRLVALALLSEAADAANRLDAEADPEALHDFRVGLRRLRSWLRAFRPVLAAGLGQKLEKRLKKLANGTNAARDAEVQLGWLRAQAGELDTEERRPGYGFLVARFEARELGGEGDRRRLCARFAAVARKLDARLRAYEAKVELEADGTAFAAHLAAMIVEGFGHLGEALAAVRHAADQERVHEARITGKRLRYLLEPLKGHPQADARDAVARLKELQDVLGDLHDVHVLADELAAAVAEVGADRARRLLALVYRDPEAPAMGGEDPRRETGLLAIARLACARRDALYGTLQGAWRGERLDALGRAVQAVADALEAHAGGHIERERKLLLSELPQLPDHAAAVEITQGYLPGERLRERVRRVVASGTATYYRTIKSGLGERRLEAEEATTREVFDALWPLTEGQRIVKRRWKVAEGSLTWEVDEFLDRELVLAEVELPATVAAPEPPPWLAPHVVRDVTGDPAYANSALARTRGVPPPGEGAAPG